MDRRSAFGGFALGVAMTLAAVVGVGGLRSAEATSSPHLSREVFSRALEDVLDRYVDPVDEGELLARGLKGVVGGLDPHSHYLTAEERKALRSRTGRGSIGAAVLLESKDGHRWLEVVSVLPESPADEAGLRPGDHILRVAERDGDAFASQAEVDAMLAGRIGDELDLIVQEQNAPGPRPMTLELSEEKAKDVSGELVPVVGGKVGIVRIRAFLGGTGEQVKKTTASLRRAAGKAGLVGLVLDLRANPGGQVDEALVVADLFIDSGVLTRTRGRGGRVLREEKAHSRGTDTQTELVVLQDRHTASAAELLAVALKDHGRALLVGERTYGKGTVQEIIGLEDGSALALTIARYRSPGDRTIDRVGVEPDVHITLEPDDDARAHRAALDVLGLQRRR